MHTIWHPNLKTSDIDVHVSDFPEGNASNLFMQIRIQWARNEIITHKTACSKPIKVIQD